MILDIVGDISAIITCITFVLFMAGRIWTIHINKNKLFTAFKFEEPDTKEDTDCIDLAGEYGAVFSVSSPKGIRVLNIYNAQLNADSKKPVEKDSLIRSIKNVAPNEKIYIRAEFFDVGSNTLLEIKRADYIKTSFLVADSAKDGTFVQSHLRHKMTIMSWLYYLCSSE